MNGSATARRLPAPSPDALAEWERQDQLADKVEERFAAFTVNGIDGATFILDAPERVPTIWGDGENVAWAAGEPLKIVGPTGVGKTTLMQRLALLRSGVLGGDLIGMRVEPSPGRILYIAADRPRQIARSFRRIVKESDRLGLEETLVVWRGPLPFDLGKAEPGQFLEFVQAFPRVTDVFVDSLKDVAVGLTDDETGSRVNAEYQRLIAAGYEVVSSHHQRKATGDNKRPRTLDDCYGSVWLVAGAGSVLLLWGRAGDPIIECRQLKSPAGEVGPLTLDLDHDRGELRLHESTDLDSLIAGALNGGLTVRDAAMQLFGVSDPDRNEIERARRKLEARVDRGRAVRVPDSSPTRYRPVERRSA